MKDCEEPEILVVTTTVATAADAQALARELVQRRLAACVQVEAGLQSCYRWEGQVTEEAEVRLSIKTLPHCRAALQALFAQLHPYQLPQFIVARVQASAAYAAWVRNEVIPPALADSGP